jgi:hypothetical protein
LRAVVNTKTLVVSCPHVERDRHRSQGAAARREGGSRAGCDEQPAGMMNDHLVSILARQRIAELRAEADRERLAASIRRRKPFRVRRGRITVEIHLSGDVRPEQVDQVFESLARHLGETA